MSTPIAHSQGETGTGKAPNPRVGAFLKSIPNRKRSLVLGFIAGPVVNQRFVHPRYVAPGILSVLKSGDGDPKRFSFIVIPDWSDRHCHGSGIVIQQAIWLYFRLALSYRDVEGGDYSSRHSRISSHRYS